MSIPHESAKMIINYLRKKGYKATPQRIAICRFALQSRDHPSAQRIYDEVRKVHPTISFATVYKTLQILKEQGVIQELKFPEGQARFDPNIKPHINLVCLQCGNIQDFDDPIAKELITKIINTTEFTKTGQRLDIYGICKTCHDRNK
jgi:Fur family peroxide stress response transcriptional regulator